MNGNKTWANTEIISLVLQNQLLRKNKAFVDVNKISLQKSSKGKQASTGKHFSREKPLNMQ